jgi:hypothetical protein
VEFQAFAAELCGKPIRNKKFLSEIFTAFGNKEKFSKTLQIAGADATGGSPGVTFQPVLALPEAGPKSLIPYKSSTRSLHL